MRSLVSRHLENFLALYAAKSMHAAAEAKGISQPALSKSLRVLESEVGSELFVRTSQGLQPTPAGSTLYRYALQLNQQARLASIDIQESVNNLYGRMRIGIGPVLAVTTFPAAIADFHEAFPKIAITVETGISSSLMEALARDSLDAVVGALPEEHASDAIVSTPLWQTKMVVIGRKGHPLSSRRFSLDELALHRRVGFVEDREFERNAATAFGQSSKALDPILETTSLSVIFGMLASTNYYAIVSDMIVPRALDSGLVRLKLNRDLWTINIGLACKSSISKTRPINAFRKILLSKQ